MDSDLRTPVVLCWHMHQPSYLDASTGRFLFPWVYLHAIKDYSDMASHLEKNPEAFAVINFAPILLEQIEAYLVQIERWRHGAGEIGDPLLAALVADELPATGTPGYLNLMEACLRANSDRIIGRFPAYSRLAEMAAIYRQKPEVQRYISGAFLADLLVWYHLGWMGESIRRENHVIQSLQEKGEQFTREDREALLEVVFDTLSAIGPRYRHLARNGQVELSVSPYTHPMLPLLLDLNCAREAMPDITLPAHEQYPGGEERALWQLEQAKRVFHRFFAMEPVGCWASEGGLSNATLGVLDNQGFRWTASGDSVLRNSVNLARQDAPDFPDSADIHRPYSFGDSSITVFFRDDGLSDLIGFSYADWHAEDAVADLVKHMVKIAHGGKGKKERVISIIMDGENAWEYYPENGFHFLDELYRVLTHHNNLKLTTYKALTEHPSAANRLPHLVAGSWIYGTFSTWIGDPDKNLAWDLLCEAKTHYDRAMEGGALDAEQKASAEKQLAVCEGSDWFWWFGDYNPAQIVSDFEHLFRRHLVNLYELIGYPAPTSVFQQLSRGSGAPVHSGTMRPGHEAEPPP